MKRRGWIVFACLHTVAFVLIAGSLGLKYVGSALLLPGFLVWFYLGDFVPAVLAVPVAVAMILMVNAITWKILAGAMARVQHPPLRQHAPR
jgi:hypothetical protein